MVIRPGGDDETQLFLAKKMLINYVAVTPVYALWHITMCRACFSALNYYTRIYISLQNLFQYTSTILVSGFTALN